MWPVQSIQLPACKTVQRQRQCVTLTASESLLCIVVDDAFTAHCIALTKAALYLNVG
jgi:hypothetical protein